MSKQAICALSVFVCVACGSDTELSGDDAMLETVVLSEAAAGQDCTRYYPGVTVEFSETEVSSVALYEMGGACALANTVLKSASEFQSSNLRRENCTLAEGAASVLADGNLARALTKLYDLSDEGYYDTVESENLKRALALCGNPTVQGIAVDEFLRDSELNVYSIGSVSYNQSPCPAVLWSFANEKHGQSYNIEGVGECNGIALSPMDLSSDKYNADGQLPSRYIKNVLRYDGEIPNDIDSTESSNPFFTDREFVQESELASQNTPSETARPMEKARDKTTIHWSSGEETVDNDFMSTAEALTFQYHLDEFNEMPPKERALAALQHSFGAPIISEVKQVELGLQPGVHVTVSTSSGDHFVLVIDKTDGMSEADLITWLPDTQLELVVIQTMDADHGDILVLESAVFSDSDNTITGQLKMCDCDEQGVLGPLGLDDLEIANANAQIRMGFIARARNTTKSRDWTMTSEFGPRSISYVVSSYQDKKFNNDAAFVVHDHGFSKTLYIAMDLTCNSESLSFDFEDTTFHEKAECRNLASGGLAYTLKNASSELMAAIKEGSQMTIGLVSLGSKTSHEKFQFSLIGATSAIDQLKADETDFDQQVIKHYGASTLSRDTENNVFALLQQRPVFCREGAATSGCVVYEEPAQLAAAKPVKRAYKRAVRTKPPEEYVLGFTKVLAQQIASSKKPACVAIAEQMLSVARSSRSSLSREQEIDALISGSPNSCF